MRKLRHRECIPLVQAHLPFNDGVDIKSRLFLTEVFDSQDLIEFLRQRYSRFFSSYKTELCYLLFHSLTCEELSGLISKTIGFGCLYIWVAI